MRSNKEELTLQRMAAETAFEEAITHANELVNNYHPFSIIQIGELDFIGAGNAKCTNRLINKDKAVDLVNRVKPDLVFVDGDAEGALEVLRLLADVDIPKIFVTVGLNGHQEEIQKYVKHILFKPVTARDLPWLAGCLIRNV